MSMRRGVGAISLLMLGLVVTGCQRGIRTEAIEAAILQDLESQGEIPVVTVSCPQRVQPIVGEAFSCTGELDSGDIFLVTVTPEDEAGNVAWEIPNSKGLLNLAILEAHFQEEIASELGVEATIDCGSTYRVNRPGDSFECAVANAIAPTSQSDQSNQADPASQTEQANPANPSDQTDPSTQAEPVLVEVVVNVDQQGNVNWQQIRRVQAAQATDSPTTAAAPAAASPTANAAPNAEQSESATATPSEAQTAEDFLDDPSALDDF